MKVSLKKILLLAGAALGLIAFVMVFVTPIEGSSWDTVYFTQKAETIIGDVVSNGAWLPFLGFILILLSAVALGLLAFDILISQKKLGYFSYAILLPTLLGVIFVFLTKANYVAVNGVADFIANEMKLGAGPILGGIFGILSLLSGAAGIYLKK